tara:strand:- start:365 stop:1591 length:1227 start_codon:yes stop_codon:yes gene_type:complete
MHNTTLAPPVGFVPGTPSVDNPLVNAVKNKKAQVLQPPEARLPRAVNFYADYSGCGHWRMIWPEMLLNGYQKCCISGLTSMILDPRFYIDVNSIRVQRQASSSQVKFVSFLKDIQKQTDFHLIYEIDDIMFHEDIPMYNKFRQAFTDNTVRDSAITIMKMCDEITVTCDYMKDYYISKLNHPNVTVIPNYIPRFWMDGFYDERQLAVNYDKNIKKRKRPRILWAGSGAHIDTGNNANSNDDFIHIIDTIIETRKKYQWVFFGAFPLQLRPYIVSKEIEFHPWVKIYDYPRMIQSLKTNIMIAPLQDNVFNKAKSDLKYIEGGAFGQPVICQDIETYQNAIYKFNSSSEMTDMIDDVLKDKSVYMKACRASHKVTASRWLEDHIQKYNELYTYPAGHAKRVELSKINTS